MGEFFHGWRRKAGCITLVMACVLTAAWVRSQTVLDYIEVFVGKHSTLMVGLYQKSVIVVMEYDPDHIAMNTAPTWRTVSRSNLSSDQLDQVTFDTFLNYVKYRNHPPVVPNGPNLPIKVPKLDPSYWLMGKPIPHWLAIPLTAISAWLLLSKPRKPATKSPEPAAEIGA